jgi:hypothetical protein
VIYLWRWNRTMDLFRTPLGGGGGGGGVVSRHNIDCPFMRTTHGLELETANMSNLSYFALPTFPSVEALAPTALGHRSIILGLRSRSRAFENNTQIRNRDTDLYYPRQISVHPHLSLMVKHNMSTHTMPTRRPPPPPPYSTVPPPPRYYAIDPWPLPLYSVGPRPVYDPLARFREYAPICIDFMQRACLV